MKRSPFLFLVLISPLFAGCDGLGGNPTHGAELSHIGDVWVRHLTDDYDREATALVGKSLNFSRYVEVSR